MTSTALALNADWLSSTASNVMTAMNATNWGPWTTGDFWTYPSYPYWVCPVQSSPARPIKLTMAEVTRLQKAAKADKPLRDILAKFTDQIEVAVSFGDEKS